MFCKRFLSWIKGQNCSSFEKLNFLSKVLFYSEKSLCETKIVRNVGNTSAGFNFSSNSFMCHRRISASHNQTNAADATQSCSGSGVASPVFRKTRITRQNAEEIEQVIQDNVNKIERFASALECTSTEMKSLVRIDTRLATTFGEVKVLETIKYLKQYGFSSSEILSNSPAFCLSIASLLSRLKRMDQVRCRRLYVLKHGPKKFAEILEFYEEEKKTMKGFLCKETYLAALFGVDETDIYEAWGKHAHLEHYSVSRLTKAFNILQDYGYSCDDIWHDPDVLILPLPDLKERLDRMNTAGLIDKADVFPYLHYRGKRQFDVGLTCWIEDQTALEGHADKISLLCSRLTCTPEEIRSLFKSYRALDILRPKRWKKVLDVLRDEMELPSETILNSPVILLYSAKRLRYRHEILKDNFINDPKALMANLKLSKINFDKKFQVSSSDSKANS